MVTIDCDIRDLTLAESSQRRIDWALAEMPVVTGLKERFARTRPLDGVRIGACLHITVETANLARTLKAD